MSCSLSEEDLELLSAQQKLQQPSGRAASCSSNQCSGGGGCSSAPCNGNRPAGAGASASGRPVCAKCRERPAEAAARVGMGASLCRGCLETGLLHKVKTAVRQGGLIRPGDRVALALSGGPSSLGLLHLLLQIRNQPGGEPLQRGRMDFQLGLLHVQEGAAFGLGPEQEAAHQQALAQAVQAAGHTAGSAAVLPLQHAFAASPLAALSGADDTAVNGSSAGADAELRAQLVRLVSSVGDVTGREDLLAALRLRLLLAAAARLGYNRLALADNASAMAARVVAETVKGRGLGLPGLLQTADGRWGPNAPLIVRPAKELTAKELAYLCHFHSIPLAPLPHLPSHPRASLNQLSAAFIEQLQAAVPTTVFSVNGTAAHLQPFPWNEQPPLPAPTAPAAPPTHRTPGQQAGAAAAAPPVPPQPLRHANPTPPSQVNGAQHATHQLLAAQADPTARRQPEEAWRLCYLCAAPMTLLRQADPGAGGGDCAASKRVCDVVGGGADIPSGDSSDEEEEDGDCSRGSRGNRLCCASCKVHILGSLMASLAAGNGGSSTDKLPAGSRAAASLRPALGMLPTFLLDQQ